MRSPQLQAELLSKLWKSAGKNQVQIYLGEGKYILLDMRRYQPIRRTK